MVGAAFVGPARSVLSAAAGAAPSARGFPVGDWQFWVVTLVALAAAAWIGSRFLPRRRKSRKAGAKHAVLTVGGRPVDRPGRGGDCH